MKDLRDLINKEQGEKLPFIQEAPKVDIEEAKKVKEESDSDDEVSPELAIGAIMAYH